MATDPTAPVSLDEVLTTLEGVAPAGTGSPTPTEPFDLAAAIMDLHENAPKDWARARAELPDKVLAERNLLLREWSRLRAELSQVQKERDAARQEAERAWSHMDGAHTDGRLAARELARQRDAAESALAALRAEVGTVADALNVEADRGYFESVFRDFATRLRALVTDQSPAAPPRRDAHGEYEWASRQVAALIYGLTSRGVDETGFFAQPTACALAEIDRLRALLADAHASDHDPYDCPNGRATAQCLVDCDHGSPASDTQTDGGGS